MGLYYYKKFANAKMLSLIPRLAKKSVKSTARFVKNHPFVSLGAAPVSLGLIQTGTYRPLLNAINLGPFRPYGNLHTQSGTGAIGENKCNKYVRDYLVDNGFRYPTKDNTYTSPGNKFKQKWLGIKPYNRSEKRPYTVFELRNLPDDNKFFEILHDIKTPEEANIGDVLTYKTGKGFWHTGFRDVNSDGVPSIRSASPWHGVRHVPLSDETFTDLKVLRPKP